MLIVSKCISFLLLVLQMATNIMAKQHTVLISQVCRVEIRCRCRLSSFLEASEEVLFPAFKAAALLGTGPVLRASNIAYLCFSFAARSFASSLLLPPSSAFEDPCDYLGTIWVTQRNLPVLSSAD